MRPGEIQLEYVDAFGDEHRPPHETIRAIEEATRIEKRWPNVLVTRHGETRDVGPAEIVIEDGTSLAIDRSLPPDLPLGYHRLTRRGAPPVRLIVAPATCHLPASLRIWGWAIQ